MRNRIRLPFYIKQAQFPTEANRFRLANGETKTLSVVIRKTYQIETDYMSESMHQRLVVALNHDEVSIEGDRYAGEVAMDGEYQIEYPDFLDYPLGKGTGTIEVSPFDATNDNCQTCEEASQLSLQDDTFPEPLEEGSEGNEINVFTNDSICCSPITASIITYNTTYVQSASIDQDTGIVSIDIKNPAPSGSGVLLATYRVTCPDGSYDEANIYGTVSGSVETCEPPSAVNPTVTGINSANVEWTASPSSPEAYGWQLFKCDDLGTIVLSGSVPSNTIHFAALTPGTCYRFVVWAICDISEGTVSDTTYGEFTTNSDVPGCGRFTLTNNLYPTHAGAASYMDCGGGIQMVVVGQTRSVCMLTNSSNEPEYFVNQSGSNITYEYEGTCADSGIITAEVDEGVSLDSVTGLINDLSLPITGGTGSGEWVGFEGGSINVSITGVGNGEIEVYYNGIFQASEEHSGTGTYNVNGLPAPDDGTTITIIVTII